MSHQQQPDDASSMSDDVFEDPETTQRRVEESRRRKDYANTEYSLTRGSGYYGDGALASSEYCRSQTPSGYPGYRPPREALQMYALEDAGYTIDDYDDGWRSYHYDEVGMPTHLPHQHHMQPFDDTVNHKTILLGDSGVGKTSFLVKYNTGEFRLGSFSATVGIALTVWIDWKCYIKRKLSANKKELMSTGGGNCRLQHISPLEDKVIHLTGLETNTSGIGGAIDFGVASKVQDEVSEMDISCRSEYSSDVPTTSKKRPSPKDNSLSLLRQQIDAQKEFYEGSKNFHENCLKKFDEVSTHLRRMNRSIEKMAEIAAKQLQEEQRHNKIKEDLLKKKIEIKLKMLKLEHPSFDSD